MRSGASDPSGPGGVPIAVLASGGGSNLQALLDHFNAGSSPRRRGTPPGRIALVVSDRAQAGALERAAGARVPTHVIPVGGRNENEIARELIELFERHAIGIVALAGYLKLVPDAVVKRYRGRIVNVHPALLPAFGGPGFYGARVHRAVLESGATVTGPTVHLVDEEYDSGRILAQWPVPVLERDTPETLAARVLEVEHVLYPAVVEALARGGRSDSAGIGFRGIDARGFVFGDGTPTMDTVRAALGL